MLSGFVKNFPKSVLGAYHRNVKTRRALSPVKWIIVAVAIAAAAAGALVALNYARPAVTVTEVVTGPVVQAFYATGTVSPVREYPVKTPIEGTTELLDTGPLIDKGSRVKKGQPLIRVVEPGLAFQAARTAAELKEKRARADERTSPVLQEFDAKIKSAGEMLEIARREQQRMTHALETRSASQFDLDRSIDRVKAQWSELESFKAQRASAVLRLRADLEVAEAAHNIALWNLEQQTLKSPIDGVVLDRPVSPGTRLAVNDHVMLVADVDPKNLVMRAQVDEENMTMVRLEQVVRMTLYSFPGEVFAGRVGKIYDKADPERRTFEVDISLERADPKLAAGMTGELAFIVAERDGATVVPAQALQDGKVYTIRGGRLTRVKATIGLKSIERVELLAGMQPGDTVVISPVTDLPEGKPVRVGKTLDPTVAAGLNKPKEKEIFRGGF
jgi:RND family efflux transporter MFP subunit